MSRLVRILLICAASLAGVYLFFLFVLVNFPYEALFSRLDTQLRSGAAASLTVEHAGYRFPLGVAVTGMSVVHEESGTQFSVESLTIRARLRPFAQHRTLSVEGSGIDVRGEAVDLRDGSGSLAASIKLRRLLRGGVFEGLASAELLLGRADIERVFISGFEFTDLLLRRIEATLVSGEEGLTLEEGSVVLDVVRAEASGSVNRDNLNVDVRISLTGDFYERFGNLQGVVGSFFENGAMTITIRGSLERPVVSSPQRGLR
jgi:type II secretion system protein N